MPDTPPLSAFPLVSIIVPSFNQGRFIRETLDSILAQDYRPIEVLVIDGASTDETIEILHQYDSNPKVDWVSEPDSGVVEAVNKGFARARGTFGAIQSSDDVYLPGAVTTAVDVLLSDPTLGFVFGDIVKVDGYGVEISRTSLPPFTLEGVLSLNTWIPQPSTFFRMDAAKNLGGWRPEIPYAADTDLWLRMAFRTKVRKIDRYLAKRRVHDAQRDRQGEKIIRDYGRMLDTLDDLADGPKRLRRAAAAGFLLMKNRYDPERSRVKAFLRHWCAALQYPALFRRLGCGAFFPGWYAIHRRGSSIRRRLNLSKDPS